MGLAVGHTDEGVELIVGAGVGDPELLLEADGKPCQHVVGIVGIGRFVEGIVADVCDKSSGVNMPTVVAFVDTAVISAGAINGISSTSAHIFRA